MGLYSVCMIRADSPMWQIVKTNTRKKTVIIIIIDIISIITHFQRKRSDLEESKTVSIKLLDVDSFP